MGPRPIDPIPEAFQSGKKKDGEKAADPDRMVIERKSIKELVPPVVYMGGSCKTRRWGRNYPSK
ncbi:MAG: hypothetical protein NTV08_17665 [Verrucomicrobia bacterium]|nr:hypothetical protein [Verrucomicrobiota bacterium]